MAHLMGTQTLYRIWRFEAQHLEGVLRLRTEEGPPSHPADPERAPRALTAPGVSTAVAAVEHGVLGFAQLPVEGDIQAFLALLAVDSGRRREGIGRAQATEGLRLAAERIDLLSAADSTGFYETFPHRRRSGFGVYPFSVGDKD
jgi:hypothetical protein